VFARLLLGNGELGPRVRAQLEAEGLVLVEENLPGSVRYHRFKAPGRYHNGKVQPQRLALAISEHRFVVYCRSGKVELMDSAFDQPNLDALEVTTEGEEKLILHVDYDKLAKPGISGEVAIHLKTPKAAAIAEQLRARVPTSPDASG
jgi:hypothetical protein